ncbi:hypothetical protein HAX54_027208, partial [Datura stramonium]|nr:hypothetical protein [Datura stramonium]
HPPDFKFKKRFHPGGGAAYNVSIQEDPNMLNSHPTNMDQSHGMGASTSKGHNEQQAKNQLKVM